MKSTPTKDPAVTAAEDKAMQQAVTAFIVINVGEQIALEDLANTVGLTRFTFCRRFQRAVGISPMRWLWTFRALLAAEMIDAAPQWSMTDVAFACGFSSSAHFSRSFRDAIGCSPTQHKKLALAASSATVKSKVLPGQVDIVAAQRAAESALTSQRN